MLSRVLMSTVVMALAFQMAQGGADQEQKEFQGAWKVTKAIENGKDQSKDSEKFLMVFKDNTFVIEKEGKEVMKGTFKLDSSKKPKQIDFKIEKGPKEDSIGKAAAGIYKLEGDTLTWCASEPGKGNRPNELAAEAGSGFMLVVLKKAKQ